MNGIINVFKPKGITSHGVVSRLRRILDMKRIGHTGTLDPGVTGVLPICIGKATRVSEYLLEADKRYIGELTLGKKTDSQDSDGIVIDTSDKKVSEEEIRTVFNSYVGPIKQIPPMYSAVRHNGKKLYELAREGIEVERKARDSTIYDLNILDFKEEKILFDVRCSKGTYIRTLCNDMGEDLETFGYMSHLIRSEVGPFELRKAYSLEYIEELASKKDFSFLLPIDIAILDFERVDLKDEYYNQVINGMTVPVDRDKNCSELHRIYCKGDFIGVGTIVSGQEKFFVKMDKVLI